MGSYPEIGASRESKTVDLVPSVVSHKEIYSLFPLFCASGKGGSGVDLLHLEPRAFDLLDDLTDAGGPDERLGVLVPGLHKFFDRLFQIWHAHEAAAPNRFLSQFSKPTLDQIQPA